MKREEIEAKLRELGAKAPPEPTEAQTRELADHVWRDLRAAPPRNRFRGARWWAPALVAAGAAAWLVVAGRAPRPDPPTGARAAFDPDAGPARGVSAGATDDMADELREFERTLAEPATAGEMLLEMDDKQLRDLLDALRKEKRS